MEVRATYLLAGEHSTSAFDLVNEREVGGMVGTLGHWVTPNSSYGSSVQRMRNFNGANAWNTDDASIRVSDFRLIYHTSRLLFTFSNSNLLDTVKRFWRGTFLPVDNVRFVSILWTREWAKYGNS